jgi:hypothetical protein
VAGLVAATHVFLNHSPGGKKAWMAGPSPANRDPALCKQHDAQIIFVPRTALLSAGEAVERSGKGPD